MKEVLKEEIGIWKENLKAVIYIFVLDLSGTVTRAVKSGVNDIWTIGGFLSLFWCHNGIHFSMEENIQSLEIVKRGR